MENRAPCRRAEARIPRESENFRQVLSRVVASIDLPFGYTLSIWAAGYLVIDQYGSPTPPDVFLFVAGAISGYILSALASFPFFAGEGVRRVPGVSLFNVVALVAAVAVSIVARLVYSRWAGFFLGGFIATLTYALLLTSILVLGNRFRSGRPDQPEE